MGDDRERNEGGQFNVWKRPFRRHPRTE